MKRSDVLRVALHGLAFVPLVTSAAAAEDEVRVRIPYGVDYTSSSTSQAPDEMLYVTVTGLVFGNPSGSPQSYRGTDFHLLAHGHTYVPVARPHLGAIDETEDGIVGPRETLEVSVTFRVPASTSVADFEFTPHWIDDNGRTVDFCCYYL